MFDCRVVSFPKSGRTWLRVILDDLHVRAQYSHEGSGHAKAKSLDDLPPSSIDTSAIPTVFLFRDPRDTVVSGFFQATKRVRRRYQGEISDFIRDPRYGIEKIARFNMEWLARCDGGSDVLPVTYEGMKADTAAAIGTVTSFCGKRIDAAAISAAVAEAEFERMREKEASGELAQRYGDILMPGKAGDPQSFKVREGIVGGFRKYLGEDDVAFCNAVIERLGYPLERHGSHNL